MPVSMHSAAAFSGILGFSIVAFAISVQSGNPMMSALACGIGAAAIASIALLLNRRLRPLGQGTVTPQCSVADGARFNSRMMAVLYGWGSLMLGGGYGFGNLSWRHDWQYALGMALIALGLTSLSRQFRDIASATPAKLSAAYAAVWMQLVGAVAGLGFLTLSGKLASQKADWAANQVFLAGGISIVLLSALAIQTHRLLAKR